MRMLVLIGSVIGAVFLFSALLVQSAQQQAALAGLACASAIIPYVLFRLQSIAEEHHQLARIVELLRQANDRSGPAAVTEGHAPSQGMVAHGARLEGAAVPPL